MRSCDGRSWSIVGVAALVLAGCYDGVAPVGAGGSAAPFHDEPLSGVQQPPDPELDALSPNPAPGGVDFAVRVTGANFTPDSVVVMDGVTLPTTYVSPGELIANSGPLPRGEVAVVVQRERQVSREQLLRVGNAAPRIVVPPEVVVDEEQPLSLPLTVVDVDDPARLRIFLKGLPPGARWDEAARTLEFVPDFTQGGRRWTVELVADDGAARIGASFDVVVVDTIRPPDPEVVDTESVESKGYVRMTLSQTTDDYLDSPGMAPRAYDAVVTVPLAPDPGGVAVRIGLHGIGTASPSTTGSASEIRIAPHDPDNTYWWGYAESLPDADPEQGGVVPDYTARRVLHLLEWTLRNFPEADPDRVYVYGSSMGGAGAMTLGLLRARHFAYVDARLGQAVPRNHRPSRLKQLSGLWGDPELGLDGGRGVAAWDWMDLTRALAESPEARDQFLFLKHGKDDPTIHFGAVVLPSPLTDESLYAALQARRVGHFAVWDEGGHGELDPVLGGSWWSESWTPMAQDAESALRNGHAFPAFTRSSLDDDPGDGGGNGEQDWSANAGYAGSVDVPGDCGWNGDIAGAIGRWLRWDDASLVDTVDRFQVAVRVIDGDGSAAPKDGYPSKGDRLDRELPASVDITPRRVQAFRCKPGERVLWQLGKLRGEVLADTDGSVTVPDLPIDDEWQTLVLRRADSVTASRAP
jgi:hypothetical protein